MKRYILTGTPGAGKTSLIRALATKGYPIIDEAATDVISMRLANGVAEPWKAADFIDAVVNLQKQRQMQVVDFPYPVQFHDRSVICCYALSKYLGRALSPLLLAEIDRLTRNNVFQKDVFFIRNLGFCEPTPARKISYEDSLVFEELHAEAYRSFGYRLVEITKNPIETRVNDIVHLVSATGW